MWEWDVRVLDIQEGVQGDHAPVCVGGWGAAPPELCGGPTGYRLMLKRQREGAAMSDPVRLEAGVQMLAEACPGQSARTWDLLRTRAGGGLRASIEDCTNMRLTGARAQGGLTPTFWRSLSTHPIFG